MDSQDRARWAADAFDRLADFVAVIDPAGDVVYANPFAERMLELEPGEGIGRSMGEFLHPEDLERAVRVMTMMVDRERPPAISPVRDWWSSSAATADRDLHDEIMGLLVSGTPPTRVVERIPEFGRWRHPLDHYAVFYDGDDGATLAAGSDLACRVGEHRRSRRPVARAARLGTDVSVLTEDLPPALHDPAEAQGLIECWARPVDDPLFGSRAVIVAWGRRDGSSMEVHRYALDTMARMLALILQWRLQVTGLQRAAPPRPAHRPGQPHRLLGGARGHRPRATRTRGWACCTWTSTGSRA